MLLMLLLLPAGMVAQTRASSSKYIATYDSDTETLTFEKYEGESLPSESEWVEDGMLVYNEFFDLLRQKTIKHIVLNESFKTFTPTTWGTCIILCLGIDVSKSKQEELDIYDTMQLCPK